MIRALPLLPSLLAALLGIALACASPLAAQGASRAAEAEALREAGDLESRGQMREAVVVLERLLANHPTASGALLTLDRLLRMQNRGQELLPLTQRYLAESPDDPAVRALRLRILADVDSTATMKREAEAWIEGQPRDAERYRQVAPVWESTFGAEAALNLLERGRSAIRSEEALAAEIGDVLLRMEDPARAGAEWARAVRAAPEKGSEVVRRVQLLHPEVRGPFAAALVRGLGGAENGVEPRMLAVQVALLGRLADPALAVAEALVPQLDPDTRTAFLEELARWGERASLSDVSLWALSTLREAPSGGGEARALDERIAEVAIAAGDTAAAAAAGGRIAAAAPAGSPERRRLLAGQLLVELRSGIPDDLEERLVRFRGEFPGSPELDEVAAAASVAFQRVGRFDAAERAIENVLGPRVALERAYLTLARGELELASALLVQATEGMTPAGATGAIQLAALLGSLDELSGLALARAAVDAHRGDARVAALTLEKRVESLPEPARPPLLAHAARLAEQARAPDDAARIRGVLLESHPDAVEAAEAALALARWHARSPAGVPRALRLLEDLILRNPYSAVVPDARRELQRLRESA